MEANNYTLPFEIIRLRDNSFPKLLAKEIIDSVRRPATKIEKELKAVSNCLNYLNNNFLLEISDELITEAYYLLTHRILKSEKVKRIVRTYYEYLNCDFAENLVMILEEIQRVIHFSKIEFAILMTHLFILRETGNYISITKNMRKILQNMLDNRDNILSAIIYFKQNLRQESDFNSLNKDDIMEYFYLNREELTLRFPLKRLYLFGSYADGMKNQTSDLDLLVIFDDNVTMMESVSLKNKLTEYLECKLGIHVDIIHFQYAMDYMDYMSLNKILTIY